MRPDRIARSVLACVALAVAGPAGAQQFTTAAEVRPMLDITRGAWVALRERGGEDQLLFDRLFEWRCGLDRVRFAVNGGEKRKLALEPCYEGEIRPNKIKAKGAGPAATFPGGSVSTVTVWLDYDDGSTDTADFRRAAILSR